MDALLLMFAVVLMLFRSVRVTSEVCHSVNVQFVSSIEEQARKDGYYTYNQVTITPSTPELEGADGDQKRLVFFKRTEETKKITLDNPELLIPGSCHHFSTTPLLITAMYLQLL